MIATQPITVEPTNMEPQKCEGWVLQELQQLSQTNPNEIFLPLLQLLQDNIPISLLQQYLS